MPRKLKKGYYVKGQFVAEGSLLDLQLKAELKGDGPSKTQRKAHSEELQQLGQALLTLRADLEQPLPLPEALREALHEARRITSFEGQRRQMQYVGKLMRRLGDDTLQAIDQALQLQRLGQARDSAQLHAAEQWRDRLIDSDHAITEWMTQHPASDAQQLRALVRQARKDAVESGAAPAPPPGAKPGQAPRKGRAYRELFQWLRATSAPAPVLPQATPPGTGDMPEPAP